MTSDPFSLTLAEPSSALIIPKTEMTLKLVMPEPFVCEKGHETVGVDVKRCYVCTEEWLNATFPVKRKSP